MAVPTPTRQNIQPVDTDLTGTDLTTTINDRIRRINEAIKTVTPAQVIITPGGGTGTFVWHEIPAGALNGTNLVFTLTHAPNPPFSLQLKLNGVVEDQTVSYTLSGLTITYTKPPVGDDIHWADYEY